IQVYPHWLPILKQDVLRLGITMPELCLRQPVQLLFKNRAQLVRTVALLLEQFAVPRLAAEWHGNDCRAIGMQQQRKWPRRRQAEQRPGPAVTPAALRRVEPERSLETRFHTTLAIMLEHQCFIPVHTDARALLDQRQLVWLLQ